MSTNLDDTLNEELPNLVTVLYADVCDSTKLYEEHGDEIARSDVEKCITVLTNVMHQFNGRLLKTIGDEIMCVFPSPMSLVIAASEMQAVLKRKNEEGHFVTGPLHIKIGAHLGPGNEEGKDFFGEVSIVASNIVKLGKADQILVSRDLLNSLSQEFYVCCRYIDQLEIHELNLVKDVVEILWEIAEVTTSVELRTELLQISHTKLVLNHGNDQIELNKDRSYALLGRDEGNDLVVCTDLTSRQHAKIEYRRGRFYLIDVSSNGTVIEIQGGKTDRIRREGRPLNGNGCICLGGEPKGNPEAVVKFRCE